MEEIEEIDIDEDTQNQTTNSTLKMILEAELLQKPSSSMNKVSNFNKEVNENLNKNKINEIKVKLLKSFKKESKVEIVKEFKINYNILDDLIKIFKTYESNIFIYHKKEILYYTKMGKIIKQVKTLFPLNWLKVFKEHNINYSKSYFNFLIQLFNLFNKNKKLYESILPLSFFKKNFTLIKIIVANGI